MYVFVKHLIAVLFRDSTLIVRKYSYRISNVKLIFYNAISKGFTNRIYHQLNSEHASRIASRSPHFMINSTKESQVKKKSMFTFYILCLQSGRGRFRVRYPLWSRYQMTKHSVVVLSSKETAKLTPWLTGHSFSCSIVVS